MFKAKRAGKIIRSRPGKGCQRRGIVASKTSMEYRMTANSKRDSILAKIKALMAKTVEAGCTSCSA